MGQDGKASGPEQSSALVCQRCGLGFIATPNYMDFLRRWGAKIVVPVQCPNCFWTQGALPKQDGTIKWFSKGKRHGYITCDDGTEVFFDQDQLVRSGTESQAGQAVQFHVDFGLGRQEALNVEQVEQN